MSDQGIVAMEILPIHQSDVICSDILMGNDLSGSNCSEMSENESHCGNYEVISSSLSKLDIERSRDRTEKTEASDFQFLKVLGMGSFGKVYQVRKVDSQGGSRIMAIKVLKKKAIIDSKKETAHTKSERNILKVAKHPFIVELLYAFQTETKLYLALEYLPGGELYSRLCIEGIFMEADVRFYSCEILLALNYLHSLGIIYRDLKPENVILDREGHIKLIDFGLCKENVFSDSTTNTLCGTLEYMAPEILTKEGHGRAADWWALGVLIYDMLTGLPPFSGENRKKTIDKILRGKVVLQPCLTMEAGSLIKRILKRTVSKRLGSRHDDGEQIKAHGFYRGVDWNDVLNRRMRPPFVPNLSGEDDTGLFDSDITNAPFKSNHGCTMSETDDMIFDDFAYVAPSLVEDNIGHIINSNSH